MCMDHGDIIILCRILKIIYYIVHKKNIMHVFVYGEFSLQYSSAIFLLSITFNFVSIWQAVNILMSLISLVPCLCAYKF